jgi:hypothetical protein
MAAWLGSGSGGSGAFDPRKSILLFPFPGLPGGSHRVGAGGRGRNVRCIILLHAEIEGGNFGLDKDFIPMYKAFAALQPEALLTPFE